VRALRRAAELSGGVAELAERTQVPVRRLEYLMDGQANVPPDLFLQAVDLLLEKKVTTPTRG